MNHTRISQKDLCDTDCLIISLCLNCLHPVFSSAAYWKQASNYYLMNKIGALLTRLRARFIDRSSSLPSPISLESSKVDSMPYTLPCGIFKLVVVTTSSVGLGAFLAKEAAQFLKNNKIFAPNEEND